MMATLGNLFAAMICFVIMVFCFYTSAVLASGATEYLGRSVDMASAAQGARMFTYLGITAFLGMMVCFSMAARSSE